MITLAKPTKKFELSLEDEETVERVFAFLSRYCHNAAIDKGFWNEPRNVGEMIALMHSELSEALEGARHGDPLSDHIQGFSSLEEEFADLFVRVFDTAAALNLNLGKALIAKIDFNKNREFMHGKKF